VLPYFTLKMETSINFNQATRVIFQLSVLQKNLQFVNVTLRKNSSSCLKQGSQTEVVGGLIG
jgi:hypothetical protein